MIRQIPIIASLSVALLMVPTARADQTDDKLEKLLDEIPGLSAQMLRLEKQVDGSAVAEPSHYDGTNRPFPSYHLPQQNCPDEDAHS